MDILELDTDGRIQDVLDLRLLDGGLVLLLDSGHRDPEILDTRRARALGQRFRLLDEAADLRTILLDLLLGVRHRVPMNTQCGFMKPLKRPRVIRRNQQHFLEQTGGPVIALVLERLLGVLQEILNALNLDLLGGKLWGLRRRFNALRIQRSEGRNLRRIRARRAQLQLATALVAIHLRLLVVGIERQRPIELAQRLAIEPSVIDRDALAEMLLRFGNGYLISRRSRCGHGGLRGGRLGGRLGLLGE